jgi:hypothetical protein
VISRHGAAIRRTPVGPERSATDWRGIVSSFGAYEKVVPDFTAGVNSSVVFLDLKILMSRSQHLVSADLQQSFSSI